MREFSKLQIRAKVLSVISAIKALSCKTENALHDFTFELENIEDKKTILDVFLKEYIKLEEEDYNFCACLIKNIVPKEYVTQKSFEYLKSNTFSDEVKYKIVRLLRIAGADYNYNELPSYFDNPNEVLDLETKHLLNSAVYNPESMLDFLDFVSAVSNNDKSLLLSSLSDDYTGDVLANIVYPVLYSDFDDDFILQAIDILLESKSSLALAPFEYLIKVSDNPKIVHACTKGLKILKLAGAKHEKAQLYFDNVVKNSQIADVFVTIPDGTGKQAVLLTRKNINGNMSIIAFVLSDISGIVDCFGFFNISEEEVIKIIRKFYNSEGEYKVKSEYAKYIIELAQNLNIEKKLPFPYEFICWKPLLTDIDVLDFSLKNYADNNCKMQMLSKENVSLLFTKEYTVRWFLTPADNKVIDELISKIYELENPDIKEINTILIDNIENIFSNEVYEVWESRFYNLIYILRQNDRLKEADEFYTILKDKTLFDFFKEIIMQRSIFSYFVLEREKIKDSFFTRNIFQKKAANKFESKKLDIIIEILKRSWLG